MAQKAFAVGGIGAQPTVDDVVKVALGLHVALDPAGADRVKKASPPPKNFQAEQCDAASASDGNQLAAVQSRAIIATKLLQLMNGKSGVRVQVAEYLVALLNHGIVPALRAANSDDSTLVQLADACHGLGDLASDQPSFAAALSSASVEAPKLSSAERLMIQGGGAASAGIGALAVQGGKKLLTLATAAAALSYEAVGAQVGVPAQLQPARAFQYHNYMLQHTWASAGVWQCPRTGRCARSNMALTFMPATPCAPATSADQGPGVRGDGGSGLQGRSNRS